jgi:hypothetical protein
VVFGLTVIGVLAVSAAAVFLIGGAVASVIPILAALVVVAITVFAAIGLLVARGSTQPSRRGAPLRLWPDSLAGGLYPYYCLGVQTLRRWLSRL